MAEQWTLEELRDELARWERVLRAEKKAETTITTYVDRTARFLRWLEGGPASR